VTDEAPAVAGIAALVIDCADPPVLARWWSLLAGGDVAVDADGDATLRTSIGFVIDFLKVPETKAVKNRLHIDLRTTDLAAATEQAIGLGAARADDVYSGGGWQVLRDPEGNEFCLLAPVGE
jgi:hypothetical protein